MSLLLSNLKKINKIKENIKKEIILILGTSGKSATSRIICETLESENNEVGTNANYDNKIRGIFRGSKKNLDYFIMEADFEEALDLFRLFSPKYIVITDFNRDILINKGNYLKEYGALKEILRNTRRKNTLIVNGDDRFLYRIIESRSRVIYYGFNENLKYLDYQGENLTYSRGIEFNLDTKGELIPIKVNALGKHNAYNMLGAISVMCELGYGLEDVEGLFQRQNMKMDEVYENYYIGGHITLIEASNFDDFVFDLEPIVNEETSLSIFFNFSKEFIDTFENIYRDKIVNFQNPLIEKIYFSRESFKLKSAIIVNGGPLEKLVTVNEKEFLGKSNLEEEVRKRNLYIITNKEIYNDLKENLRNYELE